jgi:hypothetical protein
LAKSVNPTGFSRVWPFEILFFAISMGIMRILAGFARVLGDCHGVSEEGREFHNLMSADEVREMRPNPSGVLTF